MTAVLPWLRRLTVNEILDVALQVGLMPIPREHRVTKSRLIDWMAAHSSVELKDAVKEALAAHEEQRATRVEERKRRRAAGETVRRQRWRRAETPGSVSVAQAVPASDTSKYLDLPDKARRFQCYRVFYDATLNAAMQQGVCAVCARELGIREGQLQLIRLEDIPGGEKLQPSDPHPRHTLYRGMLLEPKGVVEGENSQSAYVCNDCSSSLASSSAHPPALSLASDMWIGPIPWEYEALTVPEQMLIALLYPRVFVYKLYPRGRKGGADNTDASLQRGMRGTVSTYKLDSQGIADMVQGNLMPRPPEILSAVISITFVGKKKPAAKSWLRSHFRVRRSVLCRQCQWTKHRTRPNVEECGASHT